MDTRTIEVALGMTLIFALTSLLVSAMRELWASWAGSRGRVLQQALTSFVGDDKDFADALMNHPLLVSLTKEASGGRPSYMGADIVVTSLIASLVDRCTGGVRPASPAQLVEAIRAAGPSAGQQGRTAAALPNDKLMEGMQSLIHGVESDWPGYQARLCAWYDSVTERSIGWFKRRNQISLLFIGFTLAAAVNINPIVIAPRLWQDAPMRQALASAAEKAGGAYAQSTADGANATAAGAAASATLRTSVAPVSAALREGRLVHEARTVDTERQLHALKVRLETAMDATAKQTASAPWQTVRQGYEQLLTLRGALDEIRRTVQSDNTSNALRTRLDAEDKLTRSMATLGAIAVAADSAPHALQQPYADLDQALRAERAARTALNDLTPDNGGKGSCNASTADAKAFCDRLDDLNSLAAMGIPIGWDPVLRPRFFASSCEKEMKQKTVSSSGYPLHCDFAPWGDSLLMVFGWIITAVAASLGAPFWFDLLSKVAKLRGAGARPSAADEAGTALTPPGGTVMSQPLASGGAAGGGGTPTGSGPEPGIREPMSDALNAEEKNLSTGEVRRLQYALGMRPTQASGSFNGLTRQAIRNWQSARGDEASAELSLRQIDALLDTPLPKSAATLAPSAWTTTTGIVAGSTALPTPLLQAVADGTAPSISWDAFAFDKALAREVQNQLACIGLLDPPADGDLGPVSHWAVKAFIEAMNAVDNGQLDSKLAQLLMSDAALQRFPIKHTNDLAGRIVTAMQQKKHWICRHPDAVNIVYVEGADTNGEPNGNSPNEFNDLRTVLRIDASGVPRLAGFWPASTEPGNLYTDKPLAGTAGVARIALGQFAAWSIGYHKGREYGLVQTAPVFIYRDINKNHRRDENERVPIGNSINQHSGYDMKRVDGASAGCLVGKSVEGHAQFMALCEQDPRYLASHAYRFMTTVLEAQDLPPAVQVEVQFQQPT